MSSKKKIALSVGAFVLVVTLAVVAVVAVLAAQSVTVKSGTISISYTAVEVKTDIKASYRIKNGNPVEWGTISFSGAEQTATEKSKSLENLTIPTGQLTSVNNYIDFIFEFENKGAAGFTIASLICPGIGTGDTLENLKAEFFSAYSLDYEVSGDAEGDTPVGTMTFSVGAKGSTTSTMKFIFRYSIIDVGLNANLSGSFDWQLDSNV